MDVKHGWLKYYGLCAFIGTVYKVVNCAKKVLCLEDYKSYVIFGYVTRIKKWIFVEFGTVCKSSSRYFCPYIHYLTAYILIQSLNFLYLYIFDTFSSC